MDSEVNSPSSCTSPALSLSSSVSRLQLRGDNALSAAGSPTAVATEEGSPTSPGALFSRSKTDSMTASRMNRRSEGGAAMAQTMSEQHESGESVVVKRRVRRAVTQDVGAAASMSMAATSSIQFQGRDELAQDLKGLESRFEDFARREKQALADQELAFQRLTTSERLHRDKHTSTLHEYIQGNEKRVLTLLHDNSRSFQETLETKEQKWKKRMDELQQRVDACDEQDVQIQRTLVSHAGRLSALEGKQADESGAKMMSDLAVALGQRLEYLETYLQASLAMPRAAATLGDNLRVLEERILEKCSEEIKAGAASKGFVESCLQELRREIEESKADSVSKSFVESRLEELRREIEESRAGSVSKSFVESLLQELRREIEDSRADKVSKSSLESCMQELRREIEDSRAGGGGADDCSKGFLETSMQQLRQEIEESLQQERGARQGLEETLDRRLAMLEETMQGRLMYLEEAFTRKQREGQEGMRQSLEACLGEIEKEHETLREHIRCLETQQTTIPEERSPKVDFQEPLLELEGKLNEQFASLTEQVRTQLAAERDARCEHQNALGDVLEALDKQRFRDAEKQRALADGVRLEIHNHKNLLGDFRDRLRAHEDALTAVHTTLSTMDQERKREFSNLWQALDSHVHDVAGGVLAQGTVAVSSASRERRPLEERSTSPQLVRELAVNRVVSGSDKSATTLMEPASRGGCTSSVAALSVLPSTPSTILVSSPSEHYLNSSSSSFLLSERLSSNAGRVSPRTVSPAVVRRPSVTAALPVRATLSPSASSAAASQPSAALMHIATSSSSSSLPGNSYQPMPRSPRLVQQEASPAASVSNGLAGSACLRAAEPVVLSARTAPPPSDSRSQSGQATAAAATFGVSSSMAALVPELRLPALPEARFAFPLSSRGITSPRDAAVFSPASPAPQVLSSSATTPGSAHVTCGRASYSRMPAETYSVDVALETLRSSLLRARSLGKHHIDEMVSSPLRLLAPEDEELAGSL
eukprot:TRINITY_DN9057_c0_g1_i2.p1 TRINITY_DN9057_c0_g1~~TRINITY_DN9057_c0_g1_i2.p1  ORF type:complete len:997 (-),score=267.39 TRINITY_DN9057_c0_g1_i2:89-3079(-)